MYEAVLTVSTLHYPQPVPVLIISSTIIIYDTTFITITNTIVGVQCTPFHITGYGTMGHHYNLLQVIKLHIVLVSGRYTKADDAAAGT